MNADLPKRMLHLPLFRGLPIPYVNFIGKDGQPDFKVIDHERHKEAIRDKLCGICGGPLGRETIAFIGGDASMKSGLFTDPAMHVECARYAAKVCPYLNNGTADYSDAKPKHLGQDGFVHREFEAVSAKRPKRMGIYFTNGYKSGRINHRDPMVYIKANPPLSIDWTAMPESPKEEVEIDEESFDLYVKTMPNGVGVEWMREAERDGKRCPSKHQIRRITSDDMEKFGRDESKMHMVADQMRVGDGAFFQKLEHDWFTPGTVLNDDYIFRIFKWSNLMWSMASVPIEKAAICHETAKSCRMELVNSVPCIIGSNPGKDAVEVFGVSLARFPCHGNTVYTVQNNSDSKVYEGRGGVADERIRERFDMNKIQESYKDGNHT